MDYPINISAETKFKYLQREKKNLQLSFFPLYNDVNKNASSTSSPRAMIAHLRVNKYSHWTKCVFFFCFFSCVFFEDLIKIEDAGVATTLKIDFSNIQGQLTPQSRVQSGSNSNTSKMLWLSLFLPRMKKIRSKLKTLSLRVATIRNIDFFKHYKGQLTPQSEVRSGRNSNSSEIL